MVSTNLSSLAKTQPTKLPLVKLVTRCSYSPSSHYDLTVVATDAVGLGSWVDDVESWVRTTEFLKPGSVS